MNILQCRFCIHFHRYIDTMDDHFDCCTLYACCIDCYSDEQDCIDFQEGINNYNE